ncbi:MAG: hypothetical protein Q8910_00625 [Bacteroidota bacterium]|nr:hypothetical protein [Bacteroidota bacterium]
MEGANEKMITPMPMPIYTHSYGGGDIGLSVAIIILLSLVYVLQLAICVTKLSEDVYDNKQEFFTELIPFVPWIVKLVKKIIDL